MRTMTTLCLLAALVTPVRANTKLGSLPFHEDDYARARAEAKQRGLPMFVDVWAPW